MTLKMKIIKSLYQSHDEEFVKNLNIKLYGYLLVIEIIILFLLLHRLFDRSVNF